MDGAGSDTTERPRHGYATEYLAYVGLLVVVGALGFARRDVADLNAESAIDKQVSDGVRALSEEGEPKRAIGLLGEAVKIAPEHFNAHLHLAMALEAVHDDQTAREEWLKVIDLAEVRRDSSVMRLARSRLDKLARPPSTLPPRLPDANR